MGCIIAEIPCVDRMDLTPLRTGQVVAVDGEAGVVRILQPANRPSPLCGSEKGTFTEETMRRRLPGLIDRALAEEKEERRREKKQLVPRQKSATSTNRRAHRLSVMSPFRCRT